MTLMLLSAMLAMAAPQSEVFDLQVVRVRTLRDQPGDLRIDAQGMSFRSKDGKTNITIAADDLREASVANSHALRFETYERRDYTFRAMPDASVEDLARFLAVHIHRPVLGHYEESAQFQVAAYHRHAFGGTNGTLEIGRESIQYVSDKPADSRTWLYRDIETIGKPDAFRFRVTTSRETYVLELKHDLPEAAYQLAWKKLYNLE